MKQLGLLAAALGLLAAGCVTPAPSDVEAASADAQSPSLADALAVSVEGTFGAGVGACAVVVCQWQSVTRSERIFETDATGTVDIALEMTWDATSPSMDGLLFGVFTCDASDCNSDAKLSQIEYVYGSSPLAFELDGFTVPEGETLFVFANVGGNGVNGAYTTSWVPQAFHAEGTLTPA